MSEPNNFLDRANLQHGLAQILRCYSASGVKRFNRDTQVQVPPELLSHFTNPTVGASDGSTNRSAHTNAEVATNPAAAPVAGDAPTAGAAPAKKTTTPPPVLALDLAVESSPNLQWQLPSMDDESRQLKLQTLDEQVKACRKCTDLVCYRRQTVFGDGNIRPKVCFFGEAPGADEDAQGKPFVGAAGRLLNDIIRAMRLTREEVYILNSLKCRPPQNRTPTPDEITNCRPYALTQLEILQPEFIILLGAVAVRSVLQSDESVGRLRGRFHHFHGARVVVTYHPAYLLRTPEAKKLVWADVQMVMRELKLI